MVAGPDAGIRLLICINNGILLEVKSTQLSNHHHIVLVKLNQKGGWKLCPLRFQDLVLSTQFLNTFNNDSTACFTGSPVA